MVCPCLICKRYVPLTLIICKRIISVFTIIIIFILSYYNNRTEAKCIKQKAIEVYCKLCQNMENSLGATSLLGIKCIIEKGRLGGVLHFNKFGIDTLVVHMYTSHRGIYKRNAFSCVNSIITRLFFCCIQSYQQLNNIKCCYTQSAHITSVYKIL